MTRRHTLASTTDRRLVAYAGGSFNAYAAVYGLQQMTSLLPAYAVDLEDLYGYAGIGEARRLWGMVADLVSAIARVEPCMKTLIEFGFTQAIEVERIIAHGGHFALAESPVLNRLDFRSAILGDLGPVVMSAVDHDRVAKPLLELFQDEIRAYDIDAAENAREDSDVRSFRDLVRMLPDEPKIFPTWDGRPMFLEEQKALLDYLAKCVGTEIVADALFDEPLGEFLLRGCGAISRSDFTGDEIFDVNIVPSALLSKPVALVCHEAGDAALNALKRLSPKADLIDRLYAIENAVQSHLGIDVSRSLASTRALIVENALRDFTTDVIDLRHPSKDIAALPYEFPDLTADS